MGSAAGKSSLEATEQRSASQCLSSSTELLRKETQHSGRVGSGSSIKERKKSASKCYTEKTYARRSAGKGPKYLYKKKETRFVNTTPFPYTRPKLVRMKPKDSVLNSDSHDRSRFSTSYSYNVKGTVVQRDVLDLRKEDIFTEDRRNY
ncbi:Hypothetical predicted protein [Mytilus galloprovincialis]|uniref:Uncharacterized protein n=1 Tax=Mytilus galloprovincialis TaxID=29158 RepID=A0A8B6E4M5_MYTGA|nr:Hypothetical predicted protein [Mytilus galloprovincialis]